MDKRKRTTPPANASVTVTTVSNERLKSWRILRVATFVLGIGSIAAVISSNGHQLEVPVWIRAIEVTALVLAIIFGIILKVMKAHQETGKITFRKDSLSVQINKRTIELPLENIRAIYFQYCGYEGESYYDTKQVASFHTGLENYIQVTTDKFDAAEEILLSSKAQVVYLEKRLEEYAEKGIKFSTNPRELPRDTLLKILRDSVSPI